MAYIRSVKPAPGVERCAGPGGIIAFPLAEVAEAHRVSEQGHVRGKLVLLAGLSVGLIG